MTIKDINERFGFPLIVSEEKVPRIADVLDEFRDLAVSLYADCGDNRELTIAMERLEESAQWAVKSILKDEDGIYDELLEEHEDVITLSSSLAM